MALMALVALVAPVASVALMALMALVVSRSTVSQSVSHSVSDLHHYKSVL